MAKTYKTGKTTHTCYLLRVKKRRFYASSRKA